MSISEPARLLIVDDQVNARDRLAESLRAEHGYSVDTAETGEEAMARVKQAQGDYDVILMDQRLKPQFDGIQTMMAIRARYPHIETIVMTGFGQHEDGKRAMKEGAYRYIQKPVRRDELVVCIRSAVDWKRIKRERDWLKIMAGVSEAMSGPALDLNGVVKVVYQETVRLIPHTEVFYLALYDEQAREVRFALAIEEGEALEAAPRKLTDSPETWGLTGWIIKNRQALLINDLASEALPIGSMTFGKPGRSARSYLGIPLIARERVVGVISVQCYDPFALTTEHQRFLGAVANQAAVVLENARLHETARRQVEQLQHLRQATDNIAHATNLPDVLQQIAASVCTLLNGESSAIWPYDSERREFELQHVVMHRIPKKEQLALKAKPRPEGVASTVMREGLVFVRSVDDPRYAFIGRSTRRFFKRSGIKCFAGVPLKAADETLGILYLNFGALRTLTRDEEETLRAFAAEAAVAVKKARLLEQLGRHVERLKKEQEATRAVAGLLGSSLESTEVWRGILDGALQITGAKWGRLLHRDTQTGQWTSAVTKPNRRGRAQPCPVLPEDCLILQQAAKEGRPRLVPDTYASDWAKWIEQHCPQMRCTLVVPVKEEDAVLGMIHLESPRVAAFTPDDLRLVDGLATYARMAVQNARRYGELEQDVALRTAMLEVSQQITTVPLQRLLKRVALATRRALKVDVVNLYGYDEVTGEFGHPAVTAGRIRDRASMSKLGKVEQDSPVGRILRRGCPYYAEDTQRDKVIWVKGGFADREGIISSAGIPLHVGDETVGILFVNYRHAHAFSMQERSAIQLLAAQAALAIHDAEQYGALLRQNQHRKALYEAGRAIGASFASPRAKILDKIVEEAVRRITRAKGPRATLGVIHLYDPGPRELCLESVYPQEKLPTVKGKLGERRSVDKDKAAGGRIGISGRTVITGEPQLIDDVQSDPDYLTLSDDTRSELDVPLKDRGHVIGVLSVESKKLQGFDQDDQNTLQALAELAVVAVKSAQRQSELLKQREKLARSEALSRFAIVSNTWAHEARGAASAIRNGASLLRRDIPIEGQFSRARERIEVIDTLAKAILDIKTTGAIESEEILESVGVNALLGERATLLCRRYGGVILDWGTRVSDSVSVKIHRMWLRIAIDHLVQNALDAMDKLEGDKRLTLSTKLREDGTVEVLIQDTGPGIPARLERQLGVQKVPKKRGDKGTGTGWLVVRTIVDSFSGTAEVVKTGPGGTVVRLSLPADRW
jgi:GAF domain-containing protein/CheY-like chemotaxis protein/anti-sigma regulatory factor (Ser/Thr protein kinase)